MSLQCAHSTRSWTRASPRLSALAQQVEQPQVQRQPGEGAALQPAGGLDDLAGVGLLLPQRVLHDLDELRRVGEVSQVGSDGLTFLSCLVLRIAQELTRTSRTAGA